MVSVASIKPSSDWHIKEGCGYGPGCYPLVDFLISKDLRIRVEPRNSYEEGIFVIAVDFSTPEYNRYTYFPSVSNVNLSDGRVITSHDFTCSYTMYETNIFKSDNYLKASVKVDDFVYGCFLLYFNIYPPPVTDTFTLNIKGLRKDGVQVVIPQIHFSKGIR
jgi:hypothetical protein